MRRRHTVRELELHQRAVDRLIFRAILQREAERELREYGASPVERILPELKASLRRG